jgi:hypothetical protein
VIALAEPVVRHGFVPPPDTPAVRHRRVRLVTGFLPPPDGAFLLTTLPLFQSLILVALDRPFRWRSLSDHALATETVVGHHPQHWQHEVRDQGVAPMAQAALRLRTD